MTRIQILGPLPGTIEREVYWLGSVTERQRFTYLQINALESVAKVRS